MSFVSENTSCTSICQKSDNEITPVVLLVSADLLHEVSLRSASNRMDAHNLAIVITPNLVSSSNPILDVAICTVPPPPSSSHSVPSAPLLPPSVTQLPAALAVADGKTTLGAVIKLSIQRYYEIFDEVPDRSEAIALSRPRSR